MIAFCGDSQCKLSQPMPQRSLVHCDLNRRFQELVFYFGGSTILLQHYGSGNDRAPGNFGAFELGAQASLPNLNDAIRMAGRARPAPCLTARSAMIVRKNHGAHSWKALKCLQQLWLLQDRCSSPYTKSSWSLFSAAAALYYSPFS